MAKRRAVYAGSFDPPTEGHLNLVRRGLKLFDEVIVAVAESTSKRYVFTTAERVALWKRLLKGVRGVKVETFSGLLVNYAKRRGAVAILRGLRNFTDFEYESTMAGMNRQLEPGIEVVFLLTEPQYAHLSSSLIKEIVLLRGSVKGMVPPLVERELKKRLRPKRD
jgi:pantetheine-phosphate adenylyltransferase